MVCCFLKKKLEGPCVLQIVRVKNIAAPKDNETSQQAPPFFKITLTDGLSNCNALAMEDIQNLNLNTPPGTKILLKNVVKTKTSSLLLNNKCAEVLGGIVENLYQKWLQNKELTAHIRNGTKGENTPPAWVPFGTTTQTANQVDTSRKTLDSNETKSQEDSTSEFSQARQAALAEALQDKLKINKTFTSQSIQAPVQNQTIKKDERSSTATTTTNTNTRRSGARRGHDDDTASHSSSKPQTLTLFDMLKPKLNIKEEPQNVSPESTNERKREDRKLPPRFQQHHQSHKNSDNFRSTNNKTQSTKQAPTFNSDDFAFDLKANKVETTTNETRNLKTQSENQNDAQLVEETYYDDNNNHKKYSSKGQNGKTSNHQRYQSSNGYYAHKNSPYNQNFASPYAISYPNIPPIPPYFYDQAQLAYFNSLPPQAAYDPYMMMPPPPYIPSPQIAPTQQENQQQQQPQITTTKTEINEPSQVVQSQQQQQQNGKILWKAGDKCMAKYYFDNRFYPAIIQNIQHGRVYVSYIGYNETAELRFNDLKQYKESTQSNVTNGQQQQQQAIKA